MSSPLLPLGPKRVNSLASIEERLLSLEARIAQIPSRDLDRSKPIVTDPIIQSGHGFTVNDVVARNPSGGTWQHVSASDAPDAVGIVRYVYDTNTFDVVLAGLWFAINLRDENGSALSDYTSYYLSASTGKLTVGTGTPLAAPNTWREVLRSLKNGYVYVLGPDVDNHDHNLTDARDLDISALDLGCVPVYDPNAFGTGVPGWIASPAPAIATLSALSVFGNATNASAVGAAIGPAGANQVLGCNSAGTALVWGTVGTLAISDGAVTAVKLGSDVTLEALKDVSIATSPSDSRVANDFLTWNGTAWVNRNLGPIVCTPASGSAQQALGLDGGISGVATAVGVGATGSRLMLSGTSTVLDFLLSGTVGTNSDLCARLKNLGATGVGFYDQARGLGDGSSTGADPGDEVMEWGCFAHASASSRYFRFAIDVQFADTSGIGGSTLKVHGQAANQWRVLDSSGSTFIDFFTLGTTGNPLVSMLSDVLATKNLFIGAATGAGMAKLAVATNVLSVTVGVGAAVISVASNQIGFFNVTPVGQQSLSASITQLQSSVSATYVQSQVNNICTDVDNCIVAINAMRTALRNLGLAA